MSTGWAPRRFPSPASPAVPGEASSLPKPQGSQEPRCVFFPASDFQSTLKRLLNLKTPAGGCLGWFGPCSVLHSFPQIAHYFICINFSGEILPQAEEAQTALYWGRGDEWRRAGLSPARARVSATFSGSVLRKRSKSRSGRGRKTRTRRLPTPMPWGGSVSDPDLPVRDLALSPSLLMLSPKALPRAGDRGQMDPDSHLALASPCLQSIRPHRLIECAHWRTDSRRWVPPWGDEEARTGGDESLWGAVGTRQGGCVRCQGRAGARPAQFLGN